MRYRTVSDFSDLTKGKKPEKSLLEPIKRKGGRNNKGRITVRHQGGGHKRAYRRRPATNTTRALVRRPLDRPGLALSDH